MIWSIHTLDGKWFIQDNQPLDQALKKLGLSISDIDEAELIEETDIKAELEAA
jgi:hypothetical protein